MSVELGHFRGFANQAVEAILGSSIGQSVWQTQTVRIAAIIYVLGAVLVAWLFLDIWRNLAGFRKTARKIRTQGAGQVSFREMNTIPELTGVADDFDSLVAALKQSTAGTDYKLIRKRIDELNHATEHLAELLMNSAVSTALAGRNLAEV